MQALDFDSLDSLNEFLSNHRMVLAYFSAESCHVCKVLKPKIDARFSHQFPDIKRIYIDVEKNAELQGQLLIFSIPTIILYVDGKEAGKFSRNVSLQQLEDTAGRIYNLLSE